MPQIELLLPSAVSFFYVLYCQEALMKLPLVPSFVEIGGYLAVPPFCECELGPTGDDASEL